jgi:hypothetical protein
LSERERDRTVVVNRVHPDEHHIGDQVEKMFEDEPIPGVRLVTRDVPEHARKQRGLAPGNNTTLSEGISDLPDDQFLREIVEAGQEEGVEVVLDIHGHKGHGDTPSYPYYGELARRNPLVRGVASLLRYKGVIVLPTSYYLARNLSNYVLWDLAPGTKVETLRPVLQKLGAGWRPPIRPMQEYMYVGEVSADDGRRLGFKREYEQFEPLPEGPISELGFPVGACACAWSAKLYEPTTGFWGEVAVPLRSEFDTDIAA